VRHHRARLLLDVVRWEPVVVRADEGLEERPGPPRQDLEELLLQVGQPGLRADQRPAQPPGDARCGQPQEQDRRCETQHNGRAIARYPMVASATTGATHINRMDDSNPGGPVPACALYGFHSSSSLCETSVRQVVRTTASALT